MKQLSITLFFYFLLTGCPNTEQPVDSTIRVVNNSSQDIMYITSLKIYPDTSLNFSSPFEIAIDSSNYKRSIIKANSFRDYPDAHIDFLTRFKRKESHFVFSKDTVDQVPWEKIRSDYKILKRYDLGLKDLDSLNWTIEFN